MNEKAKEILLPHVRKLIKCITNLEPGDDKYSHCEHLVFSNIRKDTYVTVDRFAVRKSIDGIIKKFTIHSQLEEAKKLNELLDKFLSSKEFENNPQYDIQWYLLSLLLHLSYNPTSAACIKSHAIPVSSPVEEEDFDWTAYLLEGQQDIFYLNGGSETDDECYSSDELQEDGFSQSEVISKEELDLKNIQLGESNQASNVEDVMTKGILYSSLEREAKSAEEWLRENVQSPVVEDYKSRSRFASANFAEFWQSQQREKTDNSLPPKLMSEYRVLREILWTLQIPSCIPSYLQDVWKVSYLPDGNGSYRVQQSITIPSLTKGAFKSIVDWFGCHVTLVGILEQFIAEIYSSKGQNLDYSEVVGESAVDPRECFPPHTYEAYASALKDFLSYFKEKVLFVEKKVKSQEYTCTLLSVRHDLEPVMKELRLVHGIHQKSICNWRRFRNWHCACRLLTMLYGALLSSLTDVGASICFKIFMKTFQPYLEIIHVWLTEGRLEDWRKEFIIAKNESLGGCHMNFWKEGFIVRPYEDVLLKKEGGLGEELHCGFPLGLLNLIEEKVLLLGKNMELLQHLNRLSEFQKSSPLFEGTLHSELLRNLECNLKIYLTEEDEQEESHPNEQVSCDCNSPKVDNARQNLIEGLANSHDYYLRETFEDIFLQTKESCSIHSKELSCQLNRTHAKYKQPSVPVFLPIKPMLERWLCELLDERHGMSSTVVRTVLLREFALTDHLLTVRRIFLMEAGDLVHHFCTHLFQQSEMRETWVDSSLTNYLQECISTRYSDAAHQFSIVLTPPPEPVLPQYSNNSNAPAAFGPEEMWLEKIDQINLIYSVEWPINLVLNVTSMENYNTIFKFLLKVKWALWSLQQLRFSELTGNKTTNISNVEQDDCDTMPLSAKIHRLQLLRAWLLHFVGSVHSYLMGRVLHELGIKLEADLEAASDLDDIIHVHKKYLETVYQQCLQPKSSDLIKGAIMRVLEISMVLSTFWKQPSQLTSARLCEMENQYIRNHVFLASILSNAVQQGFVRHMETLSTALVHSFPSH